MQSEVQKVNLDLQLLREEFSAGSMKHVIRK